MSLDNDYERFAYDVVKFIIDRGGYRPTDELCKLVSVKLMQGPCFTLWPTSVTEANERARAAHAAAAARRPELPRPLAPPTLPHVAPLPTLPRPLGTPTLPRPLAAPQLPRILPPLSKQP